MPAPPESLGGEPTGLLGGVGPVGIGLGALFAAAMDNPHSIAGAVAAMILLDLDAPPMGLLRVPQEGASTPPVASVHVCEVDEIRLGRLSHMFRPTELLSPPEGRE